MRRTRLATAGRVIFFAMLICLVGPAPDCFPAFVKSPHRPVNPRRQHLGQKEVPKGEDKATHGGHGGHGGHPHKCKDKYGKACDKRN